MRLRAFNATDAQTKRVQLNRNIQLDSLKNAGKQTVFRPFGLQNNERKLIN